MRYIAAYLLLQIGGNASPKAGDISKLLSTVGIDCDQERLDKLLSELDGKSIDDLIAAGSSKLASVPSGGGGGGGGGGAAAATVSGGGAAAAAPKEEEKKEEPKVCPRSSNGSIRMHANQVCNYRTSLTMIWVSDCSTKRRMHACLLVGTRHTTRVMFGFPYCQCSTSITFTRTRLLRINVDLSDSCSSNWAPHTGNAELAQRRALASNYWNPKPVCDIKVNQASLSECPGRWREWGVKPKRCILNHS